MSVLQVLASPVDAPTTAKSPRLGDGGTPSRGAGGDTALPLLGRPTGITCYKHTINQPKHNCLMVFCTPSGTRTLNTRIKSPLLYQLS